MLLNIEGDLDGVLVIDFDQSEDARHQKSRKDVEVLFEVDLDLDEIVLRVVLFLHVHKWSTQTGISYINLSIPNTCQYYNYYLHIFHQLILIWNASYSTILHDLMFIAFHRVCDHL